MSEADRWLAERTSEVPEVLGDLLDGDDDEGTVPESLVGRGLSALAQATDRPRTDREGAYRLLAADAYLTYACEAAAEAEEPGRELERILDRVGIHPS